MAGHCSSVGVPSSVSMWSRATCGEGYTYTSGASGEIPHSHLPFSYTILFFYPLAQPEMNPIFMIFAVAQENPTPNACGPNRPVVFLQEPVPLS